ncbi:hypothetical protein PHJA_002160300, partial [Phtheirospermum japonicum]
EEALILFPILSGGNDRSLSANHWTLLVLDVANEHWRFLNSKRPRKSTQKDKYLLDAEKLVSFL